MCESEEELIIIFSFFVAHLGSFSILYSLFSVTPGCFSNLGGRYYCVAMRVLSERSIERFGGQPLYIYFGPFGKSTIVDLSIIWAVWINNLKTFLFMLFFVGLESHLELAPCLARFH